MPCPQDETWLPVIQCANRECKVQPKTKHASIRKSQRFSTAIIRVKIETVINYWNSGNLTFNNEGFEIDFEKIVEDFKIGRLGLAGFGR